MRRVIVLSGLMIAGGLSLSVGAFQGRGPAGPTPETLALTKIEKVKDNLYMITGSLPGGPFSGGNTAVFITGSGVVLVDTKNPGWGPRLLEMVKTVTDKPVSMIINTHSH